MRYITIPEPIQPEDEGVQLTNGKGKPVPLDLPTLLDLFCWRDKRWQSDTAWEDSFEIAHAALSRAETGAVVELQDKDHERVVAILREADFGPVLVEARKLIRAVTRATNVDPSAAAQKP